MKNNIAIAFAVVAVSLAAFASHRILGAILSGSTPVDGNRVEIRLDGCDWRLDGVPVLVPNAWNKIDGADGCPGGGPVEPDSASATSYARRRGVYSRTLPAKKENRRYFIRCDGASQIATVRVNGVEIGTHKGAFAAFCFEATDAMKRDGNRLEIEVSNEFDPSLPPLSADFTLCGGLYRSVWLIETDPVCIDPTIDGGPGVRVFPSMDGTVRVEVDVSGADDAVVDWEPKKVEKPLLWSPETPNVYTVKVTVRKGGWSDSVEQPFGFRTVEFREDGFYLNGVRRKVRGVNRHQDLEGMGWEQTPLQEERDMRLIKDMGADGVRLAHYPQSENVYNLCDRLGLMVWTEIPVVNMIGVDVATFRANVQTMLREMIAQKRNHPSVCWWGVWNELYNGFERLNPKEQPKLGVWEAETGESVKLAERLDPSRPVVAATCKAERRELNLIPQQIAINVYPRWYTSDSMRECVDMFLGNYRGNIIGISEYGVGGSVFQHENPPVFRGTVSPHHTEEYMTDVHIEDWRQIAADERVWGSFIWAMFDFAADARREGDRFGVNDKGLVTRDRVTPKDAWFFYRTNWNQEPLLHLTGKRMEETTNAVVQVVAFSNVGDVTLFVNGRKVATKTPDAVSTVRFEGIALVEGDNEIRVESGGLSDVVRWRRRTSASLQVRDPDGWPQMGAGRRRWARAGHVRLSARCKPIPDCRGGQDRERTVATDCS